jgi:hypothetical protein
MSWRFRQSFKLFPGVKINLSKSGLSTTIGSGPLHLNVGSRGLLGTASIPSSGLSFRKTLTHTNSRTNRTSDITPIERISDIPETLPQTPQTVSFVEIKSGDTSEMTSAGLEQFQKLIMDALRECRELDSLLDSSRREHADSSRKYDDWKSGFWKRTFCPKTFVSLEQYVAEMREKIDEYEIQRKQTAIPVDMELPDALALLFENVCDAFSELADSQMIWDIVSVRKSDKIQERTSASSTIDRHRVSFGMSEFHVITSKWNVPYLGNFNGGSLYIYPGFIMYYISGIDFSLIELADIQVVLEEMRFFEEGSVPSDTKIIGNTWKKTNRDGSQDKRFNGNYQIPICRYATLKLTSKSGLMEMYMASNYIAAEKFYSAFLELIKYYAEK